MQWSIPSNSESDTIICTSMRLHPSDPDLVICAFTISCVFTDIIETLVATREDLRRVQCLELSSIVVAESQLLKLQGAFEVWRNTRAAFRIELATAPGEQLTIDVGPNPRLMSSVERPALILTYVGVGIDASYYTVIDQSCVSIAHDSLRSAIRAIREEREKSEISR